MEASLATVLGWCEWKFEESLAAHARALELGAENVKHAPWMLAYLGHALGASGQTQRALDILTELSDPARQPVDVPFYQAVVWAGLGDVENTFNCLEKAYRERHARMIYLRSDETFRDFRNHPRFKELILKIGLPP